MTYLLVDPHRLWTFQAIHMVLTALLLQDLMNLFSRNVGSRELLNYVSEAQMECFNVMFRQKRICFKSQLDVQRCLDLHRPVLILTMLDRKKIAKQCSELNYLRESATVTFLQSTQISQKSHG